MFAIKHQNGMYIGGGRYIERIVPTQTVYRSAPIVSETEKPLPNISHESCPMCGKFFCINSDNFRADFACNGERYGFLWLKKCAETRAHLHQHCKRCGAKWICAPANKSVFAR